MSGDDTMLAADGGPGGAWLEPGSGSQTVFWLALLVATLMHVALIIGIGRSAPQYLGDQGGDSRAISVETSGGV